MATNNAANFSNPIGVSSGGTGVSTLTAYAPLCGGTTSTGAFQQPTTGLSTSGAVLTSNGASTLPSWIPLTALNKIGTLTASNSTSLTFDNTSITSLYTLYFVEFSQVLGATGGANFQMQLSTNNGGATLGAGFQSGNLRNNYNSATQTVGFSSSSTLLGVSSGGIRLSGHMFLSLPSSASPSFVGQSFIQGATPTFSFFYGRHSTTTTVNWVRFVMSSGNISSGSITLYGIKT